MDGGGIVDLYLWRAMNYTRPEDEIHCIPKVWEQLDENALPYVKYHKVGTKYLGHIPRQIPRIMKKEGIKLLVLFHIPFEYFPIVDKVHRIGGKVINHQTVHWMSDVLFMSDKLHDFDWWVTPTHYAADTLAEVGGVDRNLMTYVPHAVDLDHFFPHKVDMSNYDLQDKFDVKPDQKVILFVGRVQMTKGIIPLMLVARKLCHYFNCHIIFKAGVHEGVYKAREIGYYLRKMCKWDKRIHFIPQWTSTDFHEDLVAFSDIVITPCFPDGTLIKTNFGVKQIEDINIGEKVLSDGQFLNVTNKFASNYEGDLINIKVNGRQWVASTPNHLFPIAVPYPLSAGAKPKSQPWKRYSRGCEKERKRAIRGGRYRVKNMVARDLEVGDYILIPRFRRTKNFLYDDGMLEIWGYYVAEGHASKRGAISFSISTKEVKLTERILHLMLKLYGLKGTIYDNTRHRRQVIFHSKRLADILIDMFDNHSHRKCLPNHFIYLSSEKIKVLVKALWRGDGCASPRKRDGYIRYQYSTVSTQLAYQMQMLLDKIGCKSRMQFDTTRHSYDIGLEGKDAEIIFGLQKRKRYIEHGITSENYIMLPIKQIKKTYYKGKRYDLRINKISYYNTEFMCHNSGHEGSSLVPLESMACGKAVAVSDIPVHRELLGGVNGQCGLFMPVADHTEFVNDIQSVKVPSKEMVYGTLKYLLTHPDKCAEMGTKGLNRAKKYFDLNKIVKKWLDLLKRLDENG